MDILQEMAQLAATPVAKKRSDAELLAAYKATGLEPEDMKRTFNDDAVLKLAGQALGTTAEHLRNLLSIEKAGRLWMSPVPLVAGTKLYCPRKTDVQEQTLQYITLLDGEPTVSVSFECDYECDGCPHNAPYTNYDAGDGGCDGEGEFGLFNVSDVGKTVFLTREEAEAALRGEEITDCDKCDIWSEDGENCGWTHDGKDFVCVRGHILTAKEKQSALRKSSELRKHDEAALGKEQEK